MTTQGSAAALSVSRRHWTQVAGAANTPGEIADAVGRLSAQLHTGMGRWIGVEGYTALQERAMREVRDAHPALATVTFGNSDRDATERAVREHGAEPVTEGIIALVACVIELLGRIIGVEMALRLVEHLGDRARAESRAH